MSVAYPHGDLHEVLPNIFFVNGSIKIGPLQISRSMTVIKEGQRLVIVNSIRLNENGLARLDQLGRVSDVIRIGGFHGSDDSFYKERYGARVSAIEGQVYFRGTNPEKGEVYFEADHYLNADSELPLEGASIYRFSTKVPEALLCLPADGGTLISADAMHNWQADELFNFAGKLAMKAAGMLKPYRMGAGWVKSMKPDPKEISGILDLEFENVFPGHGKPVLGGAKEKYRAHIEEYLGR